MHGVCAYAKYMVLGTHHLTSRAVTEVSWGRGKISSIKLRTRVRPMCGWRLNICKRFIYQVQQHKYQLSLLFKCKRCTTRCCMVRCDSQQRNITPRVLHFHNNVKIIGFIRMRHNLMKALLNHSLVSDELFTAKKKSGLSKALGTSES